MKNWGRSLGGLVIVLGSVFAACSESSTSTPADASTSDSSSPDTAEVPETSTETDSSTVDLDLDGGTVTDGGDISPNDDGGLVDPDGGFDAGPACTALPTSVSAVSTCSSTKVVYVGGTIAAGTYNIESVTVHADANTCATTFKPLSYRAALEVVSSGKAGYVFRYAQVAGPQGGIGRASRYDLDVVPSVSSLTMTPKAPCVGNAAARVASYSAGKGKDGKDRVLITFPVGVSGTATFRFLKP